MGGNQRTELEGTNKALHDLYRALFEGQKLATFVGTGINVSTTSAVVLGTNNNRLYALLVNDSDTVIYLKLGATAVNNSDIRLNASGGSYEIDWTNLFRGAIYGISTADAKKIALIEGTL